MGHTLGLISQERYNQFLEKKAAIENEIKRIAEVIVKPTEENNVILDGLNSSKIRHGVALSELIRRPEIKYLQTKPFDPERPLLNWSVIEQVEVMIKYEGYIKKQLLQVEQFKKLENKYIPQGLDFRTIKGLRIEAIEKLHEIKPQSIGQASRISGVSPADLSVLLIALEQRRRNSETHKGENKNE